MEVKKKTSTNITKRITVDALKHPKANTRLNNEYFKAVLNNYPEALKFTRNNRKLITKYRKQFIDVLNKKLDSIDDDLDKIRIGKDFFDKHKNDTIDDILNDGDAAFVYYMIANTATVIN